MAAMILLLVAALVGISLASVPTPESYCQGKTCVSYTVISSHDGYEIREYPASVWVDTHGRNKSAAFHRLKKYFSDNGKNLKDHLPIVGHVSMGHGGRAHGIKAYLGPCTRGTNSNAEPATPTDNRVHIIHDAGPHRYYVKTLPPKANDPQYWKNIPYWRTQVTAFTTQLPSRGSTGYTHFCAAHYGRKNGKVFAEMWVSTDATHNDGHDHGGRRHGSHNH